MFVNGEGWGMGLASTMLTAGLTLATMAMPVIVLAPQEALRAVPPSLRSAAFGMGCTKWQVTKDHVLPYAIPGMMTGTILAMSRILGEAAPLIVIGAVGFGQFESDPFYYVEYGGVAALDALIHALPNVLIHDMSVGNLPLWGDRGPAPLGPFSADPSEFAEAGNNLNGRYSVMPYQIFHWAGQPQAGFKVAAAAGIVVLMLTLITVNLAGDPHSSILQGTTNMSDEGTTTASGEIVPPSTTELDISGMAHMRMSNLDLWYGSQQAIYNVSLPIERNAVTALIGPSGCGKSTLLRCLNRMNDLIPICRTEGEIELLGDEPMVVTGSGKDKVTIRRRIGMVFQKPNPFPKSIYDNVAYGVRLHYSPSRRRLDEIVEGALRRAALWDEVSDRLHELGTSLSGGQQQRLCIARAIAVEPEVLLMDEPCRKLDPIATAKIEDLINDLKQSFTVVIVTHSMSQAQRVSDYTGFMYLGRLVEFAPTVTVFSDPKQELTKRYITGRFG